MDDIHLMLKSEMELLEDLLAWLVDVKMEITEIQIRTSDGLNILIK